MYYIRFGFNVRKCRQRTKTTNRKNRTVAIEKIEPSRSATADFRFYDSYRKFTIRDRQRPAETRRFYDSYRKFTIKGIVKDQPRHGRGASHGVSAAAMPSARGGRGARAARGGRGGRGGPSPKPYPDSSPHPTPQRGGRGGRGCSLAAPSDELVQPDAPPLLAESAPQLI